MPRKLDSKCDKAYLQSFALAYTAYCVEHGINIQAVCRSIRGKGLSNMYPTKMQEWRQGLMNRPVYIYTLNVLCEEIGLKLMDFVSVRIPTEYVEVRPELLRKKPKP